ncbi:MAG TPA: hypothetical protein VN790_08270 [Steroidobacteraceae bacterium]|nr:hypothetical protein [Steroidobacteraceae bacterium]
MERSLAIYTREPVMHEFFQNTLTRQKLQQLFVNTALGNFVGYIAGSLVTLVSTYHSVERRALKNLFGVLPRKKVVVHLLPEWAEWLLALLVGFLVMEFVRYVINRRKYLVFFKAAAKIRVSRTEPTAQAAPTPPAGGEAGGEAPPAA